MLVICSWTWGLSWCVVHKISITLLMRTEFTPSSNYLLWIATWFFVWLLCICPHSCLDILFSLSLCRPCAFCHWLRELLCRPVPFCLEKWCFFKVSHYLWHLPPLLHRSLYFGRDVIKTSIQSEHFKFCHPACWSMWVSVWSFTARRIFLAEGWVIYWTMVYSKLLWIYTVFI